MVPDLLEEHRGDREDGSSRPRRAAGSRYKAPAVSRPGLSPTCLPTSRGSEGLPAERGRTVEHHEADARLRLPRRNSTSAHGIRIVPVPNTGSASTTVMTSAASSGYRTRSTRKPPSVQDQERDPHQLQLRPQPAAEASCAHGRRGLQLFPAIPGEPALQPGADGRQLAGESMKLDKTAVTVNKTASGSRPITHRRPRKTATRRASSRSPRHSEKTTPPARSPLPSPSGSFFLQASSSRSLTAKPAARALGQLRQLPGQIRRLRTEQAAEETPLQKQHEQRQHAHARRQPRGNRARSAAAAPAFPRSRLTASPMRNGHSTGSSSAANAHAPARMPSAINPVLQILRLLFSVILLRFFASCIFAAL